MEQTRRIMAENKSMADAPVPVDERFQLLQRAVECASACIACADACLGEQNVAELVTCIRLNEECADICDATARSLSRASTHAATLPAQIEDCATASAACAQECERHAHMHEHCRICGEVCRACEKACQEFLSPVAV